MTGELKEGSGLQAWQIITAVGVAVYGFTSLAGPQRSLVLAMCHNLSKLLTICTVALSVIPSQRLSPLARMGLAVTSSLFLSLLDGHFRVRRQQRRSLAVLHDVQQGLRADATVLLPVNYCMFLLGSGGHTTEMCSMIRKRFPVAPNMHRRYVITSGDNYSANVLTQLEQKLKEDLGPDQIGTYDCYIVKRSRAVHQKWYWAVWSTLGSVQSLFYALTTRPKVRPGTGFGLPNVLVTNGPGTGFILAVLAHLMKMMQLAPDGYLNIIYVESLARVKTLSLTGRLFHLTGIANIFLVQHSGLAQKYGTIDAGFMVKTTPDGFNPP